MAKPLTQAALTRFATLACGSILALAASCAAPPADEPGAGTDDLGGLSDLEYRWRGTDLGTQDVTAAPETAVDASEAAPSAGACEFPTDPEPGEPGSPCVVAGDCDSSVCVETSTGKVCTQPCIDCCPSGFKCQQQTGSSDTLYVCIPRLTGLCRPCSADSECALASPGALCLSYGDAGQFCGGGCDFDADCPADFACQDAQGTVGAAKQCVRGDGKCSCSAKAIAEGAATTCAVTNQHGSCHGTRKCASEGLTACTATAPAAEICNGTDDDCSGATDEPGAIGCAELWLDSDGDGSGLPSAAGGLHQCLCKSLDLFRASTATDCNDEDPLVSPAAAETCNGVDDNCSGTTDEGSPDTDADGAADCVDPDDDGDGSPDAVDCAPLNLAVHPSATESCNGQDDDCDALTDEADAAGCAIVWWDGDGDTFGKPGKQQCLCAQTESWTASVAGDCDDASAAVGPSMTEICNDLDDDCDAATDEGCDDDKDGWCDVQMQVVGDPFVCPKGKKDCNDNSMAIFPTQLETCGNTVDDDCDGTTDSGQGGKGCVVFFKDSDLDGFGAGESQCLCDPAGQLTSTNNKDCADDDPMVNSAKQEVCANGKDDNCSGAQDEEDAIGCELWYRDEDGDGFGDGMPACLCAPNAIYTTNKKGDCDDSNAKTFPAAVEVCNGLDDNCGGGIDEAGADGCKKLYVDGDGDGFGDSAQVACLCSPTLKYAVAVGGDCDDAQKAIHPGIVEACNGVDDNCSGKTDEQDAQGCASFWIDGDGDTFGDPAKQACLCTATAPYVSKKAGDCNDADSGVHPSAAEVCANGKDDNCSGKQDEANADGCIDWFQDGDGDGYGQGVPACLCAGSEGYPVKKKGDCDDAAAKVNPAAPEVCNGVDDNCAAGIDEQEAQGCTKYYADADNDGFGDVGKAACLCSPTLKYTVATAGDCDDTQAKANPGAKEACNGFDDDCSGAADEKDALGCAPFWIDLDGDAFGDPAKEACLCAMIAPHNAKKGGDCNDKEVAIHPAAKEICDGDDNNCSGTVDEVNAIGCLPYLRDEDGDSFGLTGVSKCLCAPASPYTAQVGGDCDDTKKALSPKAIEVCDGLDNNCDGVTDNSGADGCTPYFVDTDKDGYGTWLAPTKCLCGPLAPHTAPIGGDCDDGDPKTYLQAKEFCDGKDTDCDGVKDPKGASGCKTYYLDGDNDGWGISSVSQCSCAADGFFTATAGGDCNDQAASLNPAAVELCDSIDNNCNGLTDADAPGAATWYIDSDGDGWGAGQGKAACSAGGGYTASKNGDCNDGNPAIHPGAGEAQCNGVDEDCSAGDLCLCQAVNETFDGGASGWSLGGGWAAASWAKYSGSLGLGFGNGSSYGVVTTASSATKSIAIPSSAKTLTFWYRYSPDPGEYGGYDAFTIQFGTQTLVSLTAGTKGTTGWTQVTWPLPAGWAGTSRTFSATFNCKDGAYNSGWGGAVDQVSILCN